MGGAGVAQTTDMLVFPAAGGYDDADIPNPGLGFAYVNMAAPREFGASAQLHF